MSKRGITNYFKVYAVSPATVATIDWVTAQNTVAKLITLITSGSGEVLFDTATGIGLKKEPKISALSDGDEDNNGLKECTCKVEIEAVGMDGSTGEADYVALAAIRGTRQTFIFIDELQHLVKIGKNMLVNFGDSSIGNQKESFPITAEVKGDITEVFERKLLAS